LEGEGCEEMPRGRQKRVKNAVHRSNVNFDGTISCRKSAAF